MSFHKTWYSSFKNLAKNFNLKAINFICYEVKTGFLPDNAIVEMVTNVNEDISQDNIVKRYNALKCALPEIMVDGIYL
jgi:hypothetical protein